jgi:hypothetical protein
LIDGGGANGAEHRLAIGLGERKIAHVKGAFSS